MPLAVTPQACSEPAEIETNGIDVISFGIGGDEFTAPTTPATPQQYVSPAVVTPHVPPPVDSATNDKSLATRVGGNAPASAAAVPNSAYALLPQQ
jgi:hypothetical protein